MSIEKLPIEASLKEVIDKFEEISFQDFANIDIIVKNELPTTVKNGQIVIIEEVNVSKIILDTRFFKDVTINENEIYIQLSTHGNSLSLDCSIVTSIHELKYYIDSIYVNKNSVITLCENVFMGYEGKWNRVLDNNRFFLFKYGEYTNDEYVFSNGFIRSGSGSVSMSSDTPFSMLVFNTSTNNYNCNVSFVLNNAIDITRFNKLIFVIESVSWSVISQEPRISFGVSLNRNDLGHTMISNKTYGAAEFSSTPPNTIIEVDISNVNGYYYPHVSFWGSGYANKYNVSCSSIYLEV